MKAIERGHFQLDMCQHGIVSLSAQFNYNPYMGQKGFSDNHLLFNNAALTFVSSTQLLLVVSLVCPNGFVIRLQNKGPTTEPVQVASLASGCLLTYLRLRPKVVFGSTSEPGICISDYNQHQSKFRYICSQKATTIFPPEAYTTKYAKRN